MSTYLLLCTGWDAGCVDNGTNGACLASRRPEKRQSGPDPGRYLAVDMTSDSAGARVEIYSAASLEELRKLSAQSGVESGVEGRRSLLRQYHQSLLRRNLLRQKRNK